MARRSYYEEMPAQRDAAADRPAPPDADAAACRRFFIFDMLLI